MHRRLLLPSLIAAVALLVLSQSALAIFTRNTIDPNATLSVQGRHVLVTGPIECTQGEQLRIEITASQESAGAWGKGHTQLWCTGDLQQWSVLVVARGAATFQEGLSEVCAVGMTRHHGKPTDVREWCAANGVMLQ